MRRLDALPVAIDPEKIEAALAPFLVSKDQSLRWHGEVVRRWISTIARTLTGHEAGRGKAVIEREYDDAWGVGYERYRLGRSDLKAKPWIWRGQRFLLDPAAATRFRTLLFAAVLDKLKPRKVLEVGSGNGINLLSLAGAFPDIRFTGLELTAEGVAQSRRAQRDPDIATIVAAYSPLATRDPSALKRIDFVRGDASVMPFDDGVFDFVMTVLAVEQMESIRTAALAEIARVARHHVLMLEPFRDVNTAGLRRLYIKSRGYFEGRIDELKDHSLEPLWATGDFPQEAFLGAALVLAQKT